MRGRRGEKRWKRGAALYMTAAAVIAAVVMIAAFQEVSLAGRNSGKNELVSEISREDKAQIRGLNVLGSTENSAVSTESLPTAVSDTDPMYWMGQRKGGDINRAMVWFGEYWQNNITKKSPILWRTLRSDGRGNYGGAVTLLTEYAMNVVYFDYTKPYNDNWYNESTGSSDLRAWMNGVGTGGGSTSDPLYDKGSRRGTSAPYNQKGGGVGNIKGSFFANAFDGDEKNLIESTTIAKEYGVDGTGRTVTDKVFALNGAYKGSSSLDIFNTLYFGNDADRLCYSTPFVYVGANTITGMTPANSAGYIEWWLRSPHPTMPGYPGYVSHEGSHGHIKADTNNNTARPTINLSPNKVLFTGASDMGTAPAVSTALTLCEGKPETYSDSYAGGFRVFKRSVHPNSGAAEGFDVSAKGGYQLRIGGMPDDKQATVTYSGAIENDYLTILLVDKTNGRKWCGRIGKVEEGGSGIIKFDLPNGIKVPSSVAASSNFRLFAWTENETDKTAYTDIAVADLHKLDSLVGIEYRANGGKGSMDKSYVNGDKEATFKGNSFTRTGYLFTEWNTAADGSETTYSKDDTVTLNETTGDLEVYAIWKKEKNNLTLDPGGGTIPAGAFGNTEDTTTPVTKNGVEFGTLLSLPILTKEGYTFAGWSTDTTLTYAGETTDAADTVLAESGGQFPSSDMTSMPGAGKTDGTVKLTALWKKNVTAVNADDPMYWMGQSSSSDTQRAMVWFGKNEQTAKDTQSPILWRTLESDGQGNSKGRVTLLSEFNQQSIVFHNTDKNNQKWSESTLRTWMNGTGASLLGRPDFLSGFTAQEQGLLLNEYHEAKNHSSDDSVKKNYGSVERAFALSYDDAVSTKYFSINGEGADAARKAFNTTVAAANPIFGDAKASGAAGWWLRSPDSASGEDAGSAASVGTNGSITYPPGDNTLGARPAINLDPSDVQFTTASNTGGQPAILKDAAASTAAGTTVNKLYETDGKAASAFGTAYPADNSKAAFRVFTRTANDSKLKLYQKDGTVRVWYENVPENDYIQVLLIKTDSRKKWTGRVKEVKAEDIPAAADEGSTPTGATGSASFTLPDNIGKNTATDLSGYRIFAWTEREGTGNNLGTADVPISDTLDKLYGGEAPVISVDSGTVANKDNVGKWAEKTTVQLDFAGSWSDQEKHDMTIQYKLGSGGMWMDYNYDFTDSANRQKIDIIDEGNTTLYSRCVIKSGGTVSEMSGISYKIICVDKTAPDISEFRKQTVSDAKDNNKTKVKLTFQAADKPETAPAGSTPTKEEETEEVDQIFNSGIKEVYYTEEDLEALKKEKEDAGSAFTKSDLDQLVSDNKAEKLTALKNADGSSTDVHGLLKYEVLLDDAASQKASYAAAVDNVGNLYVTKVYDGEKLLDVTAPAKMMFAAVTNLSKTGSFQAPDYTIRNNSDLSKVKVSLNFESKVSGSLGLAKQEKVSSKEELALYLRGPGGSYSNNPFGTELGSQTKAERQFGLLIKNAADLKSSTLLGTLEKKSSGMGADPETAGSIGRFTFEAGLFPYQKNGILVQTMLHGTYQAQFHFEAAVPDAADAVRGTAGAGGSTGTE